jgi:hypothetical protein
VAILERHVDPVPRTYVRRCGALPLQGGQNIHARADSRDALSFDLVFALEVLVSEARTRGEATFGPRSALGLARWYGVDPALEPAKATSKPTRAKLMP